MVIKIMFGGYVCINYIKVIMVLEIVFILLNKIRIDNFLKVVIDD